MQGTVAIAGLGYVGFPRVVEFGKHRRTIGSHLKPEATVVYESTVYPGATQEVCIPVLEQASGKCWKQHYFVGYSPERIDPGDREHTLTRVVKVVAGDPALTCERVAEFYETVVAAGVHHASSIKAAEACKVIENTQRDLNIALMNELAIIFDRIGIDTNEVLDAAATKWNFLRLRPGLVGGHCIDVDVLAHDPMVDPAAAKHEHGVELTAWDDLPRADAIVAAVAHSAFTALRPDDLARRLVRGGCVIDVKGSLDAASLRAEGLHVWRH